VLGSCDFNFLNVHNAELHLTQTAGNNSVIILGFDAATRGLTAILP
jgi:hypothetical protein